VENSFSGFTAASALTSEENGIRGEMPGLRQKNLADSVAIDTLTATVFKLRVGVVRVQLLWYVTCNHDRKLDLVFGSRCLLMLERSIGKKKKPVIRR